LLGLDGGKKALVTGGSRGIGKGIAITLASHGYDIAITHLDEKVEAEQVAQTIEQDYGVKCCVYQADLTSPNAAGEIVEKSIQDLGNIDVLVNNAGLSKFYKMTEVGASDIDYLYNLNFRAPLLAMQSAAKHMIERRIRGSMVNITSTRAERAYPVDAVYGGLKAALKRAVESIAIEFAPYGIRVNCVAPGATKVRDGRQDFYDALGEKIPLGRMGTPTDIGNAIVWLSSEQASYITGTTVKVDGGLILPGMPEDVSRNPGDGWGKYK
jgi:glucose 1-dehydrogenase